MFVTQDIRPQRDLILVEKLEGHGIERVTKGGIIIPATNESHAKTKNDTWRGKVIAKGPKAPSELATGDVVMVFTWASGDGTKLYTGHKALTKHQCFIAPDDIVCIVDDVPTPVTETSFLREPTPDSIEVSWEDAAV